MSQHSENNYTIPKAHDITKGEVWVAWKQVKANRGAGGVDNQSISQFEENLVDNLYKIWNRMASGSYMATPVLEVIIPKSDGGERRLGIPTVSDRIAQTVVKNRIEPRMEELFHKDSYGYRPERSAQDALAKTRKRCWKFDWVIDLDIKGFFDNIDHELLLKAVDHHISEPWMRCYIRRWLAAPMQRKACGTLMERTQGTPQGGVISPILANLFLHYVFDHWIKTNHPGSPFARYADDAVIHCRSLSQAQQLLQAIKERFEACGLELHPLKTKIVYCKDDARHETHEHEKFTFLSYEFRARKVRTRYGNYFVGFNPAISRDSIVSIRAEIRSWKLLNQTSLSLEQLGRKYNATIRGWITYFGSFYGSHLRTQVLRYLNDCLARWAAKKLKRLHGSQRQARRWLHKIFHREPSLFAHWSHGVGMYG